MKSVAAMLLLTLIAAWAAVAFGQIGRQGGTKGGPNVTGRPVAVPRRDQAQKPPELLLDTETPTAPRKQPDLARKRRDTLELAALAQEIPPYVDKVSNKIFPRALPEQLKRIERLAKQLRKDISP
jgi:hypothetical protein